MRTLRFIGLVFLWTLRLPLSGQDTIPLPEIPPPYDSLKLLYPFLHLHENHLTGDTATLETFFRKLTRIGKGSGERAVVVHIGDSHIQPGLVTQPLREWLQSACGNAGRGLIFPYRVAKTNGPPGYLTRCDTPWISSRNASVRKTLPTGLAGYTLWSSSPNASFTLEPTAPELLPAGTARLILFHGHRDTCFHFDVLDDLSGRVLAVADSSQPGMTVYRLDERPQRFRFRARKIRETQHAATLYGLSMESESPGVVVHAIGVNGAMFASYLKSEHFAEQLAVLQPDLLIFSLGTNEAFSVRNYSSDTLRTNLDDLLLQIRESGTQAPVILTTPPGIYKPYRKKRRTHYHPNPVAHTVSEVLKEYARDHGMAVWDWYTVMGGRDAMAKWKAKKLTDRRYIHFSGKGYLIQGTLLREAIRERYAKFQSGGE